MSASPASAALHAGCAVLAAAGIPDAPRDARRLLAFAMGVPPDRLVLHMNDPLTDAQRQSFEVALSARARRQPVAQITGQRLFWGRAFRVTADTLDPRPETETLVAAAVAHPIARMLDLGTGSGCVLLSCLADQPDATGLGTDTSQAALAVAVRNAETLGLGPRATFLHADWFCGIDSGSIRRTCNDKHDVKAQRADVDSTTLTDKGLAHPTLAGKGLHSLAGPFDLIVSNPPYIAADEWDALPPDVRLWEPRDALTPGGDGLDAYRAIASGAGVRLVPGGRLLLEIGPTQAAAVLALLSGPGWSHHRVLHDMDGRDRVIGAVRI